MRQGGPGVRPTSLPHARQPRFHNARRSSMAAERQHPKRLETLIINDDDEQAPVLLNPLTGQMLITNPVGKRIVELADGTRDLDAIATQIVSEFRGAQI